MLLSLRARGIEFFKANRVPCLAGAAGLALCLALIWVFSVDLGGLRAPEDSRALQRVLPVSLADIRKTKLVPPKFVDRIDVDLSTLSAKNRKRDFFRIIMPLIARENDGIRQIRKTIVDKPNTVSNSLYEHYGVEPGDIAVLKRRVDVIPASLVLAQAALESGWGTSRFALDGNNLFGMRTYDTDAPGLAPASGKGFKVIKFETLGAGVAAYMRNLNTHNAYKKLRAARAEMRKSGQDISGSKLAIWLTNYSEIPEEYSKRLLTLIAQEKLLPFDQVRLAASN